MSDEKVSLDLLGARVATLTADMRDLKLRFSGIEARLGGIEARFTGIEARLGGMEGRFDLLEQRMTALLAVVVSIAERVGAERA